jgi:diguanylate cyclase (GGDEF)-like protein/PAS domain S-box-containing protein
LRARTARREKRHAEEFADSIIDSSLDMIIATDVERKIVQFNPAALQTFGYDRDEILGQHVDVLYASAKESRVIYEIVLREGRVVQEILNKRKDGENFPSLLSASILRDKRGNQLGVLGVSRDVTEQKRTEERLRYLSLHDTLTGLYNRVYFEEEMARLQRGRQFPASVIMTDVDGLKFVNDELGHAAGDELLRQAAKSLTASFRSADVVARIGGDEFAVLLPGTEAAVSQSLVSRLKRIVNDHNLAHPKPGLSLSIGTATAEEGSVLSDVLKLADQSMYRDKMRKSG